MSSVVQITRYHQVYQLSYNVQQGCRIYLWSYGSARLNLRRRDGIKMMTGNYRVAVLVVIITLGMLLTVYILILVKYVFMRRKRKQDEDDSVFQSPIAFYPWRIPAGGAYFMPHIVGTSKCERVQPRTFEELTKSEEKLAESKSTESIQSSGISEEKHAGKLKLSVQYDSLRSTLSVYLRKAKNLPRPESSEGDVIYYVTVKILPMIHRSFQSQTVKNTRSPEFDEIFQFYVPYEKLHQQSIKLTVSYFDRFSHHEPVGELMVHLDELESRGLNIAREVLLYKDINAVQKPSGSLGELMISLGYLRLTERLTVVVVAARNLLTDDETTILDSYVEVFIVHTGRKLKRKRTSVRRGDCNPVFTETLTFHVPEGILHQTSLLVCVMLDNKGRGDDQVLGQVLLGSESTGIQFEHWNEMRVNNKPVARWHKLFE